MKRTVPALAPRRGSPPWPAALAPARPASTATIQSANRVNVSATGNERNQIQVAYDSALDLYTVTDAAGVTASGMACTQVDPNTVTCPGAGIASLQRHRLGRRRHGRAHAGRLAGDDRGRPRRRLRRRPRLGRGRDGRRQGRLGQGRRSTAGRARTTCAAAAASTPAIYGDRTTGLIVTVGVKNDNDGNELDQTGNQARHRPRRRRDGDRRRGQRHRHRRRQRRDPVRRRGRRRALRRARQGHAARLHRRRLPLGRQRRTTSCAARPAPTACSAAPRTTGSPAAPTTTCCAAARTSTR